MHLFTAVSINFLYYIHIRFYFRLELTVSAVTDPTLETADHGGHVAPVVATQSHGSGGESQTIVTELELFVIKLLHQISFSSLNGCLNE